MNVKRIKPPAIAIVGRANVGKSTLWNRIVESRRALVSKESHTTRDRNIERARWRGREFDLIDTGGVDVEDDEIGRGIASQVTRALEDADLTIFVVDGKTGVLAEDRDLAKRLRKGKKPVILAVNKIDHPKDLARASEKEVFGLGIGDPHAVSAATGVGVGDLLDAAYEIIEKHGWFDREAVVDDEEEDAGLRIVIMGKPNVGKSSLTNAILGEERVIVSAIPHTTREPQDTKFTYAGKRFTLVDTAGMRKRANVKPGLEEEAMERNRTALEDADIAFLVFDATQPIGHQDKHLAGLMREASKGLVLVANKWDLVENKTTRSTDEYEKLLRNQFPFLDWAPMVFVSAKSGKRARSLLDIATTVEGERTREISYNALNRILHAVIRQKKPLAVLGPKSPHIYDMEQTSTRPPTFLVTIVGEKETVHPSWLKFLTRRLREKFGFDGTSIRVKAMNVPPSKHAHRTRKKHETARRAG